LRGPVDMCDESIDTTPRPAGYYCTVGWFARDEEGPP